MKVNGNNAIISNQNGVRTNFGQASVYRENGRIVVDAGGGDDRIDVRRGLDGRYHVAVNGQDFSFTRHELAQVTLRGGRGNDSIRIDPSVDVPLHVEGGAGNDRIFGHANRSTISGGSGHDHIAITGSDNFVRGGSGHDAVSVFGHRNLVRGGYGNDSLYAYGWGNRAYGDAGWDEVAKTVPPYRVGRPAMFSKIRG